MLNDRLCLFVKHSNIKIFFQGLLTQNMEDVCSKHLTYSLLLNNKGRYICDLFLLEKNDGTWMIDVPCSSYDDFCAIVKKYSLRIPCEIEKTTLSIHVTRNYKENSFIDPRNEKLGFRFYESTSETVQALHNDDWYHQTRLDLGIVDASDLNPHTTIPLEVNLKKAISFTKGCYLGQEFTNMGKNGLLNLRTLKTYDVSKQLDAKKDEILSFYPQYKRGFYLQRKRAIPT